jgi:Ca2+-binding RTX toxin-like protein
MRARLSIAAVVLAAAMLPASAGAAPGSTTLTGKLTVIGSEGRDDIEVDFPSGGYIEVTPAATVTGTTGVCNPETDPATGRATHNLCRVSLNESHEVLVDLRGGNDAAAISYNPQQSQTAAVHSITGSGGAGNDAVTVLAPIPTRALVGGDGDDTLAAPGRTSASQSVTWDGGLGSDIANFADTSTQFFAGAFSDSPLLHVNASLATKTVTLSRPAYSEASETEPGLRTVRTDTLNGFEGVTGGEVGDVLAGSAGADTLNGGEGPDNLTGADGADTLSGEDGLDSLNGGPGPDVLDGGTGIDTYAKEDGFNTYLARDDPTNCASVSVAQAKHRHDTRVVGRSLRVRNDSLRVRLRCPAEKTEDCEGKLAATARGRTLGSGRYRIARGGTKRIALDRAPRRGTEVRVRLKETDSDGLDRKVARTMPTTSR